MNINKYYWDIETYSNVAKNDYLKHLQYLHENGYPWNKKTCSPHIGYTPAQFLVYKQISSENKFYNTNYNNHYGDSGCVCANCFAKRKKLITNIKLNKNNIIKTPIKHEFDKKYDNAILLKVYGENPDYTKEGNIITINYVNFF